MPYSVGLERGRSLNFLAGNRGYRKNRRLNDHGVAFKRLFDTWQTIKSSYSNVNGLLMFSFDYGQICKAVARLGSVEKTATGGYLLLAPPQRAIQARDEI